jgi:bifunctional non-homologous end joining protein LigD
MPRVTFTNLDKVFWPQEGFTKGDVIAYYDRIAETILPYLRNRPMVLNRHPNGIKGKSFYQKNVDRERLPPFVETVSIRARSTGKNVHYIVCNNKATLLYLANLGCIEMHPWLARVGRLEHPDFLVVDVDPGRSRFEDVVVVARAVRDIVAASGDASLVKTSGRTGLHIYLPLRGRPEFARTRAIAKTIAKLVNRRLPRLTSLSAHPEERRHRIFLDYARNSFGQTIAAPYSLRAFPGATVSAPLDWDELTISVRPQRFTIRSMLRRIGTRGDVWKAAGLRAVNLNALEKYLHRALEEA